MTKLFLVLYMHGKVIGHLKLAYIFCKVNGGYSKLSFSTVIGKCSRPMLLNNGFPRFANFILYIFLGSGRYFEQFAKNILKIYVFLIKLSA